MRHVTTNFIILGIIAGFIVFVAVAWKHAPLIPNELSIVRGECIKTNLVSIDVRSQEARPVYDCTGVNLE